MSKNIEEPTLEQVFGEALHIILNDISEEYGNYYPRLRDSIFTIVDTEGVKCNNQSIYQILELNTKHYGYDLNQNLEFVKV
jgi:hypothetical protein